MPTSTFPLVSIVIPSYNGMPYLGEAIDSILDQDYPNIELIVLNDGSTDGTVEFLKKYQGQFYIESHANMGQAATLNKGWRMSKGEIIAYLSADDLLTKDAVSTTVKTFVADPNIILTYPDNIIIDSKSQYIRTYKAPPYDYYELIAHGKCKIGVGAFFLKSAFNQIGGWDSSYRLMPDYAYQLCLAKIGNFKYIPEVLGYSRVHPSSFSSNLVDYAAADEYIKLMKFTLDTTSDNKVLANRTTILSRAYLFSGRTHWQSKRYKIGINYLCKAIKIHPLVILKTETLRIILNAFLKKIAYKFLGYINNRSLRWRRKLPLGDKD